MMETFLAIINHGRERGEQLYCSDYIPGLCTVHPGHSGKRRDSPEERVSSAITDLMQVIDHKPNNLIETQYYDITFGTLEWLGAASS